MTEALPGVGAVETGGLPQFLRDGLQSGEVDDHVEANVLPHAHEHHGRHRPGRVAQDALRRDDPRLREPVGQKSDVRVHEEGPRDRDDAERHDERQEDRGAHERSTDELPIEEDRQRERQDDRDGRHDDGVEHRVPERVPEGRVAEQLDVVVEPHPLRRADQVVVRHRQVRRLDHRVHHEDGEHRERRGEEQPRRHGPTRRGPEAPSPGRTRPGPCIGAGGRLIQYCHRSSPSLQWSGGASPRPRSTRSFRSPATCRARPAPVRRPP